MYNLGSFIFIKSDDEQNLFTLIKDLLFRGYKILGFLEKFPSPPNFHLTSLSFENIGFFISMFYFEFQHLYSQWQESKTSNIKPVTVKEV